MFQFYCVLSLNVRVKIWTLKQDFLNSGCTLGFVERNITVLFRLSSFVCLGGSVSERVSVSLAADTKLLKTQGCSVAFVKISLFCSGDPVLCVWLVQFSERVSVNLATDTSFKTQGWSIAWISQSCSGGPVLCVCWPNFTNSITVYLNITLNAKAKLLKLGCGMAFVKEYHCFFSLYSGVWDSGKVFYKVGSWGNGFCLLVMMTFV